MKHAKAEGIRAPVRRVAGEEASAALALAISRCPDGLLAVPDLKQAHQTIYTRIESVWVDACNGEYLVVMAKLAVLKLMGHVL